MSNSVFQNNDGSARAEKQLHRAMDELEKLKVQNEELHRLASELKDIRISAYSVQGAAVKKLQKRLDKATSELKRLSAGDNKPITADEAPSKEHEQLRRKIENDAREFWYYMGSHLKQLKTSARNGINIEDSINNLLEDGEGYKRTIMNDLKSLSVEGRAGAWREKEGIALTELVQKRLRYLQNPQDCSKALKVVCNLHKGCGYGCQLHHVTYCLMVAYATGRTLILDSVGWRYAKDGWETVFRPLSNTCTDKSGTSSHHWGVDSVINNVQVVELPIIESLHPRPDCLPLSIPADLAPRLMRLHGDPSVWWIGQFVKYLTRPQPHLKDDIERVKQKLDFGNPIVGCHVRRTDKLAAEASYHSIDEYMIHIEEYYNQLEMREPVEKRRVYLASDDPTVLPDARQKYPQYTFISDVEISKSASVGSRYTDASLRGVIIDIHFLSLSDYLVCTFSSQVCRVAYELMQTMHGDASQFFYSLDDIYYYGGQNAHNMVAREKHTPRNKDEIPLEINDLVGIAGNHWNGYSKGNNKRLGKTGLFPSYKVENNLTIAKLPIYAEADNSNL
ncbi:hypothetical protein ScPMuIL_014616 [Solemya velum]